MKDDKFTSFQFKLWAEMLTSGVHTDLDVPPAASMFGCETKKAKAPQKDSSDLSAAVVMVSVVSTLSQALSTSAQAQLNRPHTSSSHPVSWSSMKRAELRSMYLKQMTDLRQLYDDGILSEEEYEEQRLELVEASKHAFLAFSFDTHPNDYSKNTKIEVSHELWSG